MKKRVFFIIVFSFAAFCLSFSSVYGQEKEKSPGLSSGRPLSEILNPDGTLSVGEGVQGSFNPKGFRMVSGLNGQPRFVPAGSGLQTNGDAFLAAAGDENWDSQFGNLYTNGTVYAIAVSGTDVYVGGDFIDAGGIAQADYIAKWNGSSWSALGTGLNSTVLAIAVSGTDVYAGGNFNQAGAKPSYYFGRWIIPFCLTSPNGGENWEVGSDHDITWTGSAGPVKIEYSTDNGSTWTTIVASTPNTGSYPWTVPSAPSSQCRVRISEASDGNPTDTSDAAFTIAGFRITSPNGGEQWIVGSAQTITWTTAGTFATVKIELSTNNASTWTMITSGTSNTGSCPWTVPDMVSSQCLIKISDSTDGIPSDVSDAVFSIIPLTSITVTSPNGGEKWTMGSTQNITWTSSGASANVKIEYSTNSGSSYTQITASTANDGTHPWTLPFANSTACLVRVSDAAAPSIFDVSNAVFSIIPIPDKRLSWTSGFSGSPAIAVQSVNKLHVVYQDDTTGNYEIYYKKSTDAGVNWTAAKKLTSTSGASKNAAIAVDAAGRLHAAWQDNTSGNYEIYYKKSTDGGTTWTADKRLTWTSGASYNPDMTVDSSGYLHLVWYDSTPGNEEIYYTQSKDKGATWTAAKRLTWTLGSSELPAIGIDASGNLHLAWQDDTPGNEEIYYKKSTDGGTTWSANKRLTWTSGGSEAPAIGIDSSGYLHIVWVDNTPGNTEIYYKKTTNAGATWSANKRLTSTALSSYSPDIAIDSGNRLHLIWVDETPGNPEISYKKSTDGGATWAPGVRLTWTIGFSEVPALGVDSSGNLHLVWQDNTPGNYEIYYKKFK